MPLKNPPATTPRRRVFSRTKRSGKTTSTRVSTPRKRSSEAPQAKILRRIGALTRRLYVLTLLASKLHRVEVLTLKQTDGARNMFEKATGKDVPDKVSN
jgi:hypothetical protein